MAEININYDDLVIKTGEDLRVYVNVLGITHTLLSQKMGHNRSYLHLSMARTTPFKPAKRKILEDAIVEYIEENKDRLLKGRSLQLLFNKKVPALEHLVTTIQNYPHDGNHQQCYTGLPFCIRKGEDGYYYQEDGDEKAYNIFKGDKIEDRWICHLHDWANESLKSTFKVKVNKSLYEILAHCKSSYIKSLKLEVKRIKKEVDRLEEQ